MQWTKLGHVYIPDGSRAWMRSHACAPTTHPVDDNTIRIYATFLDADLVGRVGFVDVDAADPLRVIGVSPRPALDVGDVGTFDEHGVTPSTVVRDGETLRLYYTGLQRAITVPYLLFGGLAVSEDGGETFERLARAPILPRVDGERLFRSAPFICREDRLWRAWYVAADRWSEPGPESVPKCEIRSVSSEDGVRWKGPSTQALAPSNKDEIDFGRPCLLSSADGYRMWYSIRRRSRNSSIGYATSKDGVSWTRRDGELRLDVSQRGWDSEMVGAGAVVTTPHGTYLFYNGNGFGETGFGAARLEDG